MINKLFLNRILDFDSFCFFVFLTIVVLYLNCSQYYQSVLVQTLDAESFPYRPTTLGTSLLPVQKVGYSLVVISLVTQVVSLPH